MTTAQPGAVRPHGRGGVRAAIAGLAVAGLLTLGAVSVFASEAEETAGPDSSAAPATEVTERGEGASDRGDCPAEASN